MTPSPSNTSKQLRNNSSTQLYTGPKAILAEEELTDGFCATHRLLKGAHKHPLPRLI